jgi:hypothetical protein
MTDLALRTFTPGLLARLIGRVRAWLDEPVVRVTASSTPFDDGDWDLPVHHPVQS